MSAVHRRSSQPQNEDLKLRRSAFVGTYVAEAGARSLVALESLATQDRSRHLMRDTKYIDSSRIKKCTMNDAGEFEGIVTLVMEKIRSMTRNNNKNFDGMGNRAAGITRVGKILRKLGVDEIRQMRQKDFSLVGVRPVLLSELDTIAELVASGELPLELVQVWCLALDILKPGVVDADAPMRKQNDSITEWVERMIHDIAFAAQKEKIPDLPAAILMTSFESMVGGKKGKLFAKSMGISVRARLSVREARELYQQYIASVSKAEEALTLAADSTAFDLQRKASVSLVES